MPKDINTEQFLSMIKQLVSDVQGAPYPGTDVNSELYSIWYEHVQKNAQEVFEFLEENFPLDKEGLDRTLQRMFK